MILRAEKRDEMKGKPSVLFFQRQEGKLSVEIDYGKHTFYALFPRGKIIKFLHSLIPCGFFIDSEETY